MASQHNDKTFRTVFVWNKDTCAFPCSLHAVGDICIAWVSQRERLPPGALKLGPGREQLGKRLRLVSASLMHADVLVYVSKNVQ